MSNLSLHADHYNLCPILSTQQGLFSLVVFLCISQEKMGTPKEQYPLQSL